MYDGDLLILKGNEISALLSGRELDLIETVRRAYIAHGAGASSLPHSIFLRFPDDQQSRIIALPAYLGEGFDVAGIKWVSSFPRNLSEGLERASAVVILNSARTGSPEAIIEGSIISAKRTAASAALAARTLHASPLVERVGMVGCGLINFEIARALRAVWPSLTTLVAHDLDAARAAQFKARCEETFAGMSVEIAPDITSVLRSAPLISLATTATTPYVGSLAECAAGATVLHVSLRDLTPEVILSADNVVDDIDHVCRAQTSVHLAEQLVGNRAFIRASLADILSGAAPACGADGRVTVFSPFGLGVLDLAVAQFVCELARREQLGLSVNSFLPTPWHNRAEGL
jgi:ornithine cyclodeaminase